MPAKKTAKNRPRKTQPKPAEAPLSEAEIERRVQARLVEEKAERAINYLCAPDREFTPPTFLHGPNCRPDKLDECGETPHGCDTFEGLEVEAMLRKGWYSDLVV